MTTYSAIDYIGELRTVQTHTIEAASLTSAKRQASLLRHANSVHVFLYFKGDSRPVAFKAAKGWKNIYR